MTFEESIRMVLTNNTERYKKTPCFIYVMHIEGTNFYKFGTAENVTKRKSNIISEWKREKDLSKRHIATLCSPCPIPIPKRR